MSIEPQQTMLTIHKLDEKSVEGIRKETENMTAEQVLDRVCACCNPDTIKSGGMLDLMYADLVSERLGADLYLQIYKEKLAAEAAEQKVVIAE